MKLLTLLLTLGIGIGLGAQQKAVIPASGPAPVGPYSPGVIADGYLYVSGQGAKTADGQMPATFEAQAQQTLENVKAVVEAAGLTLEDLVVKEDASQSRQEPQDERPAPQKRRAPRIDGDQQAFEVLA